MVNGLIFGDQLVVPDNQISANQARYVFLDSGGWKASKTYWSSHKSYLTLIPANQAYLQKNVIGLLPIFLEIDFLEMKRIFYFIIGNNIRIDGVSPTDRRFAISYRDVNGKRIIYGKDPAYAAVCFNFISFFNSVKSI